MSDRTRRSFLGLTGAGLAGLAGCVSAPDSPDFQQGISFTESFEGGEYTDLVEATLGSVALVRSSAGPTTSQGSGFISDTDHLVTNEHVVGAATQVDIQYTEHEWTTGTVVGTDQYSDLAVIELDERPDYAVPLSFSEHRPRVGQEVLAIGNPLGFTDSVSQGIISAVGRALTGPGEVTVPDGVQTDAALNQGNSGGPLVNLDGEVAGVVSAGAGEGIGFGISAGLARRVVPALREQGTFSHSYLGVELLDVSLEIQQVNDLPTARGTYVFGVAPDSPADDVLEPATGETVVNGSAVPTGGDVITAIDDHPIDITDDVSTTLALHTNPGDLVELTVFRDGSEETIPIELGAREQFE